MLKHISIGLIILGLGAGILGAEEKGLKEKLNLYKDKVNAAAQLLAKEGMDKAEPKLLDKKGAYFFDGDQGYIFIIDTKGMTHLNAAKPALKGKNLLPVKDIKGFAFFGGFISMAQKYTSGWVAYWWPKPGVVEASSKVSYVKLVSKDGIDYVVGAGPYDVTLEEIRKVYPEEMKKDIQ